MQTKRVRIGHNMVRAVAFVAAHPGCAKTDVAIHLHGHTPGLADQSGGYATVKRAVAAGLLRAVLRDQRGPRCYSLHVTQLGNQLVSEDS